MAGSGLATTIRKHCSFHSNSFPAFCPRSKQMLILRSQASRVEDDALAGRHSGHCLCDRRIHPSGAPRHQQLRPHARRRYAFDLTDPLHSWLCLTSVA